MKKRLFILPIMGLVLLGSAVIDQEIIQIESIKKEIVVEYKRKGSTSKSQSV